MTYARYISKTPQSREGLIEMWEEERSRHRATVYGMTAIFWLIGGLVVLGIYLRAELLSNVYQSDRGFTHYDMVLQRCDRSATWTLHGLWPSYNATSWPQYCYHGPTPVVRGYDRLRAIMEKEWSSCDPDHDEAFWRHEYLRHGTCSDYDTPYRYFSAALGLYEKYLGNGTVAARCRTGERECVFRVPRYWNCLQWLAPLLGC